MVFEVVVRKGSIGGKIEKVSPLILEMRPGINVFC